jgi:hypothetical protein
MTDSLHEEVFLEPKSSSSLKLIAGIAAVVVTLAVVFGYAYLRRRHAEQSAAIELAKKEAVPPKLTPKALVLVDDALIQGNRTVVGGIVKNTSAEVLRQVTVGLELRRRKDATTEQRFIALTPADLETGQEGRYSMELKASDYGSARLVGLRVGSDSSLIAYTSGAGQKRAPERLEQKTIIVGRPAAKPGEFLNSPDNPARVP